MSETQSIRYWFALIFSTIISVLFALAIIVICKFYSIEFDSTCLVFLLRSAWFLLWKFVLSRFGVLRALFQLNQNDKPTTTTVAAPTPSRRPKIRRE